MSNPEYEKKCEPYSPESMKRRMNHPHLVGPEHQQLDKVEKAKYPKIGEK